MVEPIEGALGWLQYTSKHADRGVAHYQRQGMPPGWLSMPQVWSRGGDWPVVPPLALSLEYAEFVRFRRLVRAYVMAERRGDLARAERWGDDGAAARARKSLRFVKGSLKCSERGLSSVRGRAEWCPQPMVLRLAEAAGWDGVMV